MLDQQFEVALRLRLYMNQNLILPGTKCDCSGRPLTVHQAGHHYVTGCSKDGVRIQTHNQLNVVFAKVLNQCGVLTAREERHIYTAYDTNSQRRPDLTAFNLPGECAPHYFDFQVTNPVPSNGGRLSFTQANDRLRPGNRAAAQKLKSYAEPAAHGLPCTPLIMGASGRMEPTMKRLLITCLQHASEVNHIPFHHLWYYWVSAISVTLQKGISNNIIQRCFSTYSVQYRASYKTNREAIWNSSDQQNPPQVSGSEFLSTRQLS
jgi:hypothetical protein